MLFSTSLLKKGLLSHKRHINRGRLATAGFWPARFTIADPRTFPSNGGCLRIARLSCTDFGTQHSLQPECFGLFWKTLHLRSHASRTKQSLWTLFQSGFAAYFSCSSVVLQRLVWVAFGQTQSVTARGVLQVRRAVGVGGRCDAQIANRSCSATKG
jgi:hypothetical protein